MTRSGSREDVARQAAARVEHEVFKDGISTGRKFSSLIAATRYARTIGGEVRARR